MKIVSINDVDDCTNGSFIKEILFDNCITEDFIKMLGNYGKLAYYKNFARPYFKVVFESNNYIKGVEGNNTARLMINNENDIKYIIEVFNKGGSK